MKYTYVIWDWNGTLADDVQIAVECVNGTLKKFGINRQTDREEYLQMITPSLTDYYAKLIDLSKHTMTEIFESFQQEYKSRLYKLKLNVGAINALDYFKNAGAKQFIVSSFEETALKSHIRLMNVENYFEGISGSGDIHCGSKSDRAKAIADKALSEGGWAVLIGDSINDYNTAREANCDCILSAQGHQSSADLKKCRPYGSHTVKIIDNLCELNLALL